MKKIKESFKLSATSKNIQIMILRKNCSPSVPRCLQSNSRLKFFLKSFFTNKNGKTLADNFFTPVQGNLTGNFSINLTDSYQGKGKV